MLFENKLIYRFSIIVTLICFIIFAYISYTSIFLVKNKYIEIDGKTYINQTKEDEFTKNLSKELTKNCFNKICKVQSMLDYVTTIPYKTNNSIARSGKNIIKNNYGDCDDKSNFLISMLHAQGFESYFVFVPKHVFIIVNIKQKIRDRKALYLNKTPFYILETTAKNSKIGFPFRYKIKDVKEIINPFKNKKVKINLLEYKY